MNATSLVESPMGPPQVLLSIGETAQYLVTVQFPRGSTSAANVTLTLASTALAATGVLELLSAQIVFVGSALQSSRAGALAVGVNVPLLNLQLADGIADTAVFSLGDVQSSLPASADGQLNETAQVVFAVTARVPAAVAANVANASVPVAARFDYLGATSASGVADSAVLSGSLVTPALSVAVRAPTSAQAGQTVSVGATLTQLPTSSAAAYALNVSFASLLANGLQLQPNSIVCVPACTVLAGGNGGAEVQVQFAVLPFSLSPAPAAVSVSFNATVLASLRRCSRSL